MIKNETCTECQGTCLVYNSIHVFHNTWIEKKHRRDKKIYDPCL